MYPCNSEPSVQELLTDPVARLVMARDGLRPDQVRSLMTIAKRKLAAAELRQQACANRESRAPALTSAR